MKNFEKIKSMSVDELAEFLDKQSCNQVSDDFCSNYCKHRQPNYGCEFEQKYNGPFCAYDDLQVIKKWLESEIAE